MKKSFLYLSAGALLAATALIPAPDAKAEIPLLHLDSASGQEPTLAPMIRRVIPAVVNISTKTSMQTGPNPLLQDPFFRDFFNLQMMPICPKSARCRVLAPA